MHTFEEDDWVIKLDPLPGDDIIFQLTRSDFYGVSRKSNKYFEGIELWKPKIGEWCWFWNVGSTEYVLAEFKKSFYDGRFYNYETQKGTAYLYCKPFIGNFPTY